MTWAVIIISLLTASTNCINAQRSSSKAAFIERVNTIIQTQNSQNSDSIFNVLREEAWSLKQDSLYVDLTFQQIEKNKNSVDIFQITSVLEDLMVKEYEFLKNHPKLLIFCYLNMSKYHLSRHKPSKSDLEISKYYFNRYLEILKTIPLSDSDITLHQNHRLYYLEKTHNDSHFFI